MDSTVRRSLEDLTLAEPILDIELIPAKGLGWRAPGDDG
jgi:hypothetical protein